MGKWRFVKDRIEALSDEPRLGQTLEDEQIAAVIERTTTPGDPLVAALDG